MCTVSVVAPSRAAQQMQRCVLRVVCNRDERRSRAEAFPPIRTRVGGRHAIFPVDAESGGTWFGVNDAGLIVALLNSSGSGTAPTARKSRGEIVPDLLACDDASEAIGRLGGLECGRFPPFRLLVVDRSSLAIARSDGATIDVESMGDIPRTLMLASSSLGDHLVQPVRRQLFESLVERSADPITAQDSFHAHRWEQSPHLSVLMCRADARSVSRTTIEIGDASARLEYESIPESADGKSVRSGLSLEFARLTVQA